MRLGHHYTSREPQSQVLIRCEETVKGGETSQNNRALNTSESDAALGWVWAFGPGPITYYQTTKNTHGWYEAPGCCLGHPPHGVRLLSKMSRFTDKVHSTLACSLYLTNRWRHRPSRSRNGHTLLHTPSHLMVITTHFEPRVVFPLRLANIPMPIHFLPCCFPSYAFKYSSAFHFTSSPAPPDCSSTH